VNETNTLPNVAIFGRPNVGKSALFNRLVGRKIAIVHDRPGITRDRLSATCTRGQRPFTLWDTGGILGAGESDLTQQVERAAENALRESDLLLLVVDAKDGLSPVDEELARMLRKRQKPVVLVINKIDSDKHDILAPEFDSLGFEKVISVSAEHGRGITQLVEIIDRALAQRALVSKPSQLGARKPLLEEDSTAIAIVGRPNVGKSSLINAIVRSERAIVSELPGTTRDAIDIVYERDDLRFVFIDTAGIRRRGKVSSSAEVFSVMRAERSIHRADLCVLVIDLTMGVTAQDKRIAGSIQKARKPVIAVLNKWDLVKPGRGENKSGRDLIEETRSRIFFLDYAPVLITSASTGENVDRLFALIQKVRRAARKRIGTGVLNRLLRQAFEANPPAMVKGRRLKLFYITQSTSSRLQAAEGMDGGASEAPGLMGATQTPRHVCGSSPLQPPEFVLFVNDPSLMSETYRRYLDARIRNAEPYPGLPIILTLRPRVQKDPRTPKVRTLGKRSK
jgi:GTPase